MEKINIAMQITEAKQHCSEMATASAKSGKSQAMNKLRYRSSLAILGTLQWVQDHEAAIRAYNAERKGK